MSDYAEDIRAAAQALLEQQAIALGEPYTMVRDNWGWSLDTQDYPALSVFLPREKMTPDGDANAGEPSFVNDFTIFIAVSLGFARPEDLKDQMRVRRVAVLELLLQAPEFLRLFESVQGVEWGIVFSKEGETFLAELQIKFSVRLRTDWPPDVPDDFKSAAITFSRLGRPTPSDPTLIVTVPEEETP